MDQLISRMGYQADSYRLPPPINRAATIPSVANTAIAGK